jgi:predicted dehydrogenase
MGTDGARAGIAAPRKLAPQASAPGWLGHGQPVTIGRGVPQSERCNVKTIRVGIIMNGVTGRMGTNQHLIRSVNAIRKEGGVVLPGGRRIVPDPILVGRDRAKLEALAQAHGVERWTTDLDAALADKNDAIYFDSASTGLRPELIRKAIAAGKHIYTEKPVAPTVADALDLYRRAEAAGVKHGVVQDKLWLPGLLKLKMLIDGGFFGRILSVRGEFGYWVFEGDWQPAQRPSWNYRKEDDGGIIVDMLCHWRYVLDNLFGAVKSVMCLGTTHIAKRWDEHGKPYAATADDAAYATFELADGVIAQINSSWCTRVRRDDLVTFHVDGTLGSAVAGLTDCRIQPRAATPKPVWNPDVPQTIDFHDTWQLVPANRAYDNAFKVEWELFLRHVVDGGPFRWNLLEGAKGVQLAELGLQSWRERRFVDVPALPL